MISLKKYILPAAAILMVAVFVYVFTKIIIYFAASILIALIGMPLTNLISKIKFGNRFIPRGLASLITLLSMYSILLLFILSFVPPVIKELNFISGLNFSDLIDTVLKQFPAIKKIFGSGSTDEQTKLNILSYFESGINPQNLKIIMNDTASIFGSLLAGLLAVSFISFFLLKDKTIVLTIILLLTPADYEDEISRIIHTTRIMLTKYFTGLLIDVILVMILVGLSMYFFGIRNSFLIAVFAGIMNIIPYVGPLISMGFALFLGITGCLEYNEAGNIETVVSTIFLVLMTVNLLDAIVLQPYIFSSSVKAHPLEIFIVILMAATVSGVWGMVVAIPFYTLFRIVAKEFFSNSKFFRKISENIT